MTRAKRQVKSLGVWKPAGASSPGYMDEIRLCTAGFDSGGDTAMFLGLVSDGAFQRGVVLRVCK